MFTFQECVKRACMRLYLMALSLCFVYIMYPAMWWFVYLHDSSMLVIMFLVPLPLIVTNLLNQIQCKLTCIHDICTTGCQNVTFSLAIANYKFLVST